jgi:uncharacterized membrane protein
LVVMQTFNNLYDERLLVDARDALPYVLMKRRRDVGVGGDGGDGGGGGGGGGGLCEFRR